MRDHTAFANETLHISSLSSFSWHIYVLVPYLDPRGSRLTLDPYLALPGSCHTLVPYIAPPGIFTY